ncbi:cytochrome P450 family protein [Ceratobasidium sp. AG-Ba]|nr:cytochrome P450 family protein [Ceratobasidium sp. AG-Ba]
MASSAGKRTFLSDVLDQMKDKDGNVDMDEVLRQLASLFIAATGPTSGLLSFTMYELLKNEVAYQKVQSEIDKVLESETCTADHLDKFPYITAVLRETLRLHPPVPAHAVLASEKTIIGGRYEIEEGSTILIHDRSIQRDTHENAWGPDANEFKPERMQGLEVEENGMTKDMRFKPFGNGSRSCLGHEFAMMIAKLVIVSLFQRFEFRLADTSYELRHKQRIALQPSGLRIIASPRGATTPAAASTPGTTPSTTPIPVVPAPEPKKEQPIYILWGGRDGTCENYAETLSRRAPPNGYKPIMAELNRYSGKGKLPTDGPVIIIAATYSGFPTANAKDFYNELLNAANSGANGYEGVRYSVFGCGRSGWSNTYQKIPIALDEMLAKCGATKLIERGAFDAGKPITADAFDDWEVKLWAELERLKIYNVTRDDSLHREVYEIRKVGNADSRHRILRQRETIAAVVVENRVISKPDPGKSGEILPARHLELQMKPDEACHYQPGDIVSILPTNSVESVRRVFAHFKIALEQDFRAEKLSDSVFNSLPAGERVKLFELLVNYVEIGKPAQKSHLRELMNHTKDEVTKATLQAEIDSNLSNTIENHTSVLDYLEIYSDIEIPFNKFFFMLPQMRTREYSISSSARWNPDRLTLSYQEHEKGVSSGYLARLMPGDVVRFTHRLSSHVRFGLPERPEPGRSPADLIKDASTPVVMFATGTGVAPFRAMIQDRSEQAKRGVKVGKMTLFFGCRDPEKDYLYGNSDFKEWSEQGILDMRPAFSKVGKCQRIQHRVDDDKEDIKRAYFEGARFLTCGNVGASEGLMKVGARIVQEGYKEQGRGEISREDAEKFISDSQIYFTDVFG